jgi:hypothetical protein
LARRRELRDDRDNLAESPDKPDKPDKPTSLPAVDQLFADIPDEQKEKFAELVYPEIAAAWQRIAEDAKATVDVHAARAGDQVAISVLRIGQALLVAARRKDLPTLQEWEKLTVRYMEEHALHEYVALSLPPRAKHDRHLVLSGLRKQISEYLHREHKPIVPGSGMLEGVVNQMAVSMRLYFMVQALFPHLTPDRTKEALLSNRIETHMKTERPLSEIEPEDIILDGLEMLGVPRPTGWNWLKGAK